MYLHEKEAGPCVVAVVRELMPKVPLVVRRHHQIDSSLKLLIGKCIAGPSGQASAKALLQSLRAGFADHSLYSYDFEEVIAALFAAHPIAALDELAGAWEGYPRGFIRAITIDGAQGRNPLADVPPDALISWCRSGDPERWALLADSITPFTEDEDKNLAWTSFAFELIRQSPEPIKVIHALVRRIAPMSWSGSRANIMSKRLPLLDVIESFLEGEALAEIRKLREDFQRQIERERAWEQQERNRGDNSFE